MVRWARAAVVSVCAVALLAAALRAERAAAEPRVITARCRLGASD